MGKHVEEIVVEREGSPSGKHTVRITVDHTVAGMTKYDSAIDSEATKLLIAGKASTQHCEHCRLSMFFMGKLQVGTTMFVCSNCQGKTFVHLAEPMLPYQRMVDGMGEPQDQRPVDLEEQARLLGTPIISPSEWYKMTGEQLAKTLHTRPKEPPKPNRTIVYTLAIQADDVKGLRNALRDAIHELDKLAWGDIGPDNTYQAAHVGHDASHTIKIEINPYQTHDKYFEQLTEWLKVTDEGRVKFSLDEIRKAGRSGSF